MIRSTAVAVALTFLAGCSAGNRQQQGAQPEFLEHTKPAEAVYLPRSAPAAAGSPPGSAPLAAAQASRVPVWHVRQGQTLSEVVREWGSEANRTIVWQTNHDWPIVVSDQYAGTFDAALAWVLAGVADANPRPRAQQFQNSSVRILSEE